MPPLFPLRVSRPLRTPDSRGGSVTGFDGATARVLWAEVTISQDGDLVASADEDVRIGDVIELPTNLTISGGLA